MAVYRQIHVTYWQDPGVLKLTPEQKFFYLYLMTNSKTRQCGCYEISPQVMQFETGYNLETIDKLISMFTEMGKIEYSPNTCEVLLKNWHKYNRSNSPKVITCIENEINTIKYKPFKQYCIDTLLYSTDTDPQKEKEEEQEKEGEQEKEQTSVPAPYENIKQLYHDSCPDLRKVKTVSGGRKTHIKARWKQYDCDISIFAELFQRTRASPFLQGKNDRGWKADFDWLINENNMAKVLEGKYDEGGGLGGGSGPVGRNTEKGEYEHLYE